MITDDLREFLATIDTAFVATADRDGQPYVQHRGGPKGFIAALDDERIAFADVAGNRQYITVGNLGENAKIALILIDYTHRRRVKIWGTAEIVATTPDLLAQLLVPPKARVERVFVITVMRWDVNCPAHIPVKIDAADVNAAIARYEARIAELESELERREPRAGGMALATSERSRRAGT
jgi:hypothetical protein